MASGADFDCYAGLLKEGNPSEVDEDDWIWAVNESEKNNRRPDKGDNKCGKWLIFKPVDEIDEAWESVRSAVTSGKLGHAAKVSTMKDKEEHGDESQSVICVYTYDWTDIDDVNRVRGGLCALGYQKKLPYKTDEATRAGHYSAPGKRVSKYYY